MKGEYKICFQNEYSGEEFEDVHLEELEER
jgi:hypothetical protein